MENFTSKAYFLLDEILARHKLKSLYPMSTSGDFLVRQCRAENGVDYILKVRQRPEEELRQQFINEIILNLYLGKKYPDLFPYQVKDYNFSQEPEFLLYKMLPGYPFNGYYFYLGQRNERFFRVEELLELLQTVQNSFSDIKKEYPDLKLNSWRWQENFAFYQKYAANLATCFSAAEQKEIEKTFRHYAFKFRKNLVLTHGDFNPKNILILNEEKITFLDWTDAHLNNPFFDLAKLYFACWNVPFKKHELKRQALIKIKNDALLFNLNILLLGGNFLQILQDSLKGLEADYQQKILSYSSFSKLREWAYRAQDATCRELRWSYRFCCS